MAMEPNMIPDRERCLARREPRNRGSNGMLAAALAASLTLGGCSAVPDWADPSDWFAEDPAPTKVGLAEGQARSQPTGYPNLASVPNQPPKTLSLESRAQVQASLAADRANAVYSGEQLTGSAPAPASATQTAMARSTTVQALSDAPPAPEIGNELSAAVRIPAAPAQTQVAQTQMAQTQMAQVRVPPPPAAPPQIAQPQIAPPQITPPQIAPPQIAQAAGGQTQLRFPQFQNLQPQAAAAPAVAALPAVAGARLVAVIYFGHSSARLDAKDRGVLRDVVALQRQSGAAIRVVGHASAMTAVTDQISHDLANFEMSLKRANAVAAELIALGVARDRVRAEARSDKQPVYHEFMSTGQAGNRRAEIFLEN
jgi:outer membrane protein OmpA-like peptidoglycan-associated protein